MRWNPVDLVVMDIMLPDGSGLELCREIKSRFHIPVLFLAALGENKEIVEGLRAGGDDYLTKPYDLEVLVARVEARLTTWKCWWPGWKPGCAATPKAGGMSAMAVCGWTRFPCAGIWGTGICC